MYNFKKQIGFFSLIIVGGLLLNGCSRSQNSDDTGKVKVFGVYASPKEEQFAAVIDAALKTAADNGKIEYSFIERIGYDGDMERVLSEICLKEDSAIIIGDGFGNEEAVRKVAANCQKKIFIFAQDGELIDPNLAVFDNTAHEIAYLAGMVAGGSTKSNIIGVVGARPIAQANRLANAFIAGAIFNNPEITIKTSFNDSFFDSSLSQESATEQIASGVDVIYALCSGVIDAVKDTPVSVIGNVSIQTEKAPNSVLTSLLWDIQPTINHLIDQVANGAFKVTDIDYRLSTARSFSSLATLNPRLVSNDLALSVSDRLAAIQSRIFQVAIDDQQPAATVRARG